MIRMLEFHDLDGKKISVRSTAIVAMERYDDQNVTQVRLSNSDVFRVKESIETICAWMHAAEG